MKRLLLITILFFVCCFHKTDDVETEREMCKQQFPLLLLPEPTEEEAKTSEKLRDSKDRSESLKMSILYRCLKFFKL